MADPYYYQENDQTLGPYTPQQLKQLAEQGVIGPATLVRKGEQGAWYQAGTIAGLVPPKLASNDAPAGSAASSADRARQTIRKAEEQADKVAAKLWFLDLKFTQFFTPKLIGAMWAIYLCLLVLLFIYSAIYDLVNLNALFALAMIAIQFVGLLFAAVSSRVILEVFLVIFRMAEYLEPLKHLEYLKHLADEKPRSTQDDPLR